MSWDTKTYLMNLNDNPFDTAKYGQTSSSWFQRSWWESQNLVKKYVNDTGMSVKLSSISFKGCPGHSGGLPYSVNKGGNTGRDIAGGCGGYGCDLYVKMYVIDTQESSSELKVGHIDGIDTFNVQAHGERGKTCTIAQYPNTTVHSPGWHTTFGNPAYFGPTCGEYYKDSKGRPRCEQIHTLVLADSLIIPPDATMYVHVYPKNWDNGSNYDNSLLVMRWGEGNFSGVVEPADDSYIWIMTEEGWEKSRVAYRRTADGWEEVKE